MKRIFVGSACVATALFAIAASAQTALNVYGPGSPPPVM
jgi:hypothetical protein